MRNRSYVANSPTIHAAAYSTSNMVPLWVVAGNGNVSSSVVISVTANERTACTRMETSSSCVAITLPANRMDIVAVLSKLSPQPKKKSTYHALIRLRTQSIHTRHIDTIQNRSHTDTILANIFQWLCTTIHRDTLTLPPLPCARTVVERCCADFSSTPCHAINRGPAIVSIHHCFPSTSEWDLCEPVHFSDAFSGSLTLPTGPSILLSDGTTEQQQKLFIIQH